MTRKPLHSAKAPKAIGPYSQAVETSGGKMVFLSGQTPLDPATGELVQGDVRAQTERVMENLREVLAAGGLDFSHVVRCGVFLTDMGDFAAMNEVYGRSFPGTPPARTTVEVRGLPRGARVEIDCIAVVPTS
ncbi:MAG: RidA family protein [Myxococcaceae bacterium]|nr:RidA family protein [Myxococcaceae bacterium]MCI0669905.1 RidA family protein [Myxococcaceae bacterium]